MSSEDQSVKSHVKILSVYAIVGFLDYYIYSLINIPLDSKEIPAQTQTGKGGQNLDSLMYYIFSCEFIFLLIKLLSKLVKLVIDLTQLNMKKHWNHKLIVFNIISFLKYAVKLFIEIVIYFSDHVEVLHCAGQSGSSACVLHYRCVLLMLAFDQAGLQVLRQLQDHEVHQPVFMF